MSCKKRLPPAAGNTVRHVSEVFHARPGRLAMATMEKGLVVMWTKVGKYIRQHGKERAGSFGGRGKKVKSTIDSFLSWPPPWGVEDFSSSTKEPPSFVLCKFIAATNKLNAFTAERECKPRKVSLE